jgi:hypothetical protein
MTTIKSSGGGTFCLLRTQMCEVGADYSYVALRRDVRRALAGRTGWCCYFIGPIRTLVPARVYVGPGRIMIGCVTFTGVNAERLQRWACREQADD